MNTSLGKVYTGGDSIACFFAVITGLFNLSMLANQFKAVVEGKVAGKFVFEVIDRVPTILINEEGSELH